MGGNQMPTVADFLKIEPLTSELVLEIGYLPQCTYHPRHCGNETCWTIEANFYCTSHKDEIEQKWEGMIVDWIGQPAQAQDEDLELMELVRDEFPDHNDIYPHVAVDRVTKDLNLSETPEGRSIASWYLWKMGIFSIHERVMFFEAATT